MKRLARPIRQVTKSALALGALACVRGGDGNSDSRNIEFEIIKP
jgi:hypothetical protein